MSKANKTREQLLTADRAERAAVDAAAQADRAEQAREAREDAAADAAAAAQVDQAVAAAAAPAPTAQLRLCGCGCQTPGTGRFRPGHDARLHGRAKRRSEGRMPEAEWTALLATERHAVTEFLANGTLHGSFAQPSSKPAPKSQAQREHERLVARATKQAAELAETLRLLGLATAADDVRVLVGQLAE